MLEAKQCMRLKTEFEHHCVVNGMFRPYKANVVLWLENSPEARFDNIEDRCQIVDYIWDNLWKIHSAAP